MDKTNVKYSPLKSSSEENSARTHEKENSIERMLGTAFGLSVVTEARRGNKRAKWNYTKNSLKSV